MDAKKYLAMIGKKGGAAGTGQSKARDPEKMREAQKKAVAARLANKKKSNSSNKDAGKKGTGKSSK